VIIYILAIRSSVPKRDLHGSVTSGSGPESVKKKLASGSGSSLFVRIKC
jgi:hypothetical protein